MTKAPRLTQRNPNYDNSIERKRIERKCPRCKSGGYHPAHLFDAPKYHVFATCAECSYQWNPRVVHDEWDFFMYPEAFPTSAALAKVQQ